MPIFELKRKCPRICVFLTWVTENYIKFNEFDFEKLFI